MNLINFTNFFPGLERSNEVYFGKSAPLPLVLQKYTPILKKHISEGSSNKLYSNKKWILELTNICNKLGEEVSKCINVEKTAFIIQPDDNMSNAANYVMFSHANYVKSVNGSDVVDLDKIAEFEDIEIIPNEGYRFRNKKNKYVCIILFTGLILKNTEDEIVATILHEIGHCFQNGIYGLYKEVADEVLTAKIKSMVNRNYDFSDQSSNPIFNIILKLPFGKFLLHILFFFFFIPSTLTEKFFDFVDRCILKYTFAKQFKNTKYKAEEIIAKIDKGEKIDNSGDETITSYLTKLGAKNKNERSKYIEDMKKTSIDALKNYDYNKEDKMKNTILGRLVSMIYAMKTTVKMTKGNIDNVIKLNRYSMNKFHKLSFIKKYEFFADIFASSYGYAPALQRTNVNSTVDNVKELENTLNKGINKTPLFNSIMRCQVFMALRNISLADEHGTIQDRVANSYTMLIKELDSNVELTPDQKKEIKEAIKELKECDDLYYNQLKMNDGFFYKVYNKMLDKKLAGENLDTVEQVLKPIEEVCKASVSKLTLTSK